MDECPVCLEACDEETGVIIVECCKKRYHATCFDKCIQLSGQCPTCRSMYSVPLPPIVLVEVRGDGMKRAMQICIVLFMLLLFPGVIVYGVCVR